MAVLFKAARRCLLPAALLLADAATVSAQTVLIPKPGTDFSAYRVDCDVFGWSKDFKEMAALGDAIRRYPNGKQRGESFLLVYDVGSKRPKQNVHVMYDTQGASAEPLPILDIRDMMWQIDVQFQNMWPRRPRRKYYPGAMHVDVFWESVQMGDSACTPAVGAMLRYHGELRYESYGLQELKASCNLLRMTDVRTYWAKRDLGAIMVRFDYSPDEHELSIRFPLSTAWRLGTPVHIGLRSTLARTPTRAIEKQLAHYGHVSRVAGTPDPRVHGAVVHYDPKVRYLALHVARKLGGVLSSKPPPASYTLLVDAAPVAKASVTPPSKSAGSSGAPEGTHHATAAAKASKKVAPKKQAAVHSTYLDDFHP